VTRGGRFVLATIATTILALMPLPGTADDSPGPVDGQFSYSGADGSIDYVLHVPAHTTPIPLLVYLHGCGAPPSVPGLNGLADLHGFAVAYPVRPLAINNGCWKWTDNADQHRDHGDPALIAGVTRSVIGSSGIDPARVYVAGHSAGSGMTTIMAAAYPDLYAAAGLIAGCGKLTCLDITGISARTEMGPRARAVPVYMLWGTQDATNPYLTGRLQLLEWLGMNDLADDGLLNLSVPRLPSSVRSYPAVGTAPPYRVEQYLGRHGGDVTFVSAIGMEHVPDATWPMAFPAMVAFLLAH